MNAHTASTFLLACAAFNYVVLLIWFAAFTLAHGWMLRLHRRWFQLSDAQFDSIHYLGMALYKLAILFFNLVPYLALQLVS